MPSDLGMKSELEGEDECLGLAFERIVRFRRD